MEKEAYDIGEVAALLGTSEQELTSFQNFLPVDKLSLLWQQAYESRGNTVGLQAGQRIKLVDLSDVGVFLSTTEDLTQLANETDKYFDLMTDFIEKKIRPTTNGLLLSVDHKAAVPLRDERLEFVMAAAITLAASYLGGPVALAEVKLTRPRPQDPNPWIDMFGIEPSWGAEQCSATVSYTEATRLLLTRNSVVRKALGVLLSARLAAKTKNNLSSFRNEIVKQLPEQNPNIQSVASALNLSTRSFQRRLKELDTTFSELLAETRAMTAKQLLAQKVSVAEVAFRLGYSEISVFHRAFKRWTGMTVQEHLKTNRDQS